ncbi:MAG: Trm112 family protein [Pirellulales bacterium]|nr:Trm112 family protein [Pirellulales bacterium]
MISDELLEILRCPESRQPLKIAPVELIAQINAVIAAGRAKNRAGETVAEVLEGALVREDGTLAYPVRDAIPVMLIDEAIPLDAIRQG